MAFNPKSYILPIQGGALMQEDKVLGSLKYRFYCYCLAGSNPPSPRMTEIADGFD